METLQEFTAWLPRLYGPNKGKKYKRVFKDEAHKERIVRKYRILEAEQNMLPKKRNLKYEEMARVSRRERTIKLVRKIVENKANLIPEEEIMQVIEKSVSPTKLRIMSFELRAFGYNAHAILAEGKAEFLENKEVKKFKDQDLYKKIMEVKKKHALI